MFKLRPHHGLCIQHFAGKGYSDEFISYMTDVISYLNSENPLIELVCSTDEICSCCPNNQNGFCNDIYKVSYMDQKCLDLLSLKENTCINYQQYKTIVLTELLSNKSAPEVCNGCQWYSLCYK